ncbi:MAG TPA: hypothetical protein DCE43_13960, partial [Planctomycetaceae bacterium]|nr:hypothetical protein [Planctomycetaceae bacterium]
MRFVKRAESEYNSPRDRRDCVSMEPGLMLTVFSGRKVNDRRRMSRRSFLQVGTCTVGGLSLSDVLTLEAAQAVETPF